MTVSQFFYFLGVGAGLSMDAFAISIANCTTFKNQLNKKIIWSMPLSFAFFQFLMPVIGFYVGSLFVGFLSNVADYLTAAVFLILALKIAIDNVKDVERLNYLNLDIDILDAEAMKRENKDEFTRYIFNTKYYNIFVSN